MHLNGEISTTITDLSSDINHVDDEAMKTMKKILLMGIAGICCIILSVADCYAAGKSTSGKSHLPVVEADADESLVSGIAPQNGTAFGALNGYTYRHDWGLRNGQSRLTLNWCAISPSSKVYVSITEVDANGTPFVGSARYTVHNVSPSSCKVTTWVNIEWGAPIRLIANYTVLL